ncbi:MAG TPA: bifunctional UDP-sugar hydrolase/5'-nucleotidase [Vicinamibacterales bacterium]|jgi:5'-nucleotidase
MVRRHALIAVLVLWAAGPHIEAQRPVDPSTRSAHITISVMLTTDLHGGVLQRGERGGLAMLGGYVRNLRAARLRDGGGTLLVDSGDMFQGTLESNLNEGAAVVQAYNTLGYAAAAIGNHEFDFGPAGPNETPRTPGEDPRGALKARAAQARFPFLASNTVDEATGKPVAWPNIKPSTMVTVRGVTIGLVGVTTIDTAAQTIAANLGGLTFTPLAPAITREATSLRAQGATVVIVLAHAGGRCTRLENPEDLSSCDPMAEIVNVARQLPAGLVDMISAGHTHQAMAQDVAGIAVVEAYSGGRAFSRVDLTVNRSSGALVSKKIFQPHDVTPGSYERRAVTPDAAVTAAIAPAVRKALAVKTQPLGVHVDTPFVRGDQQDETALADLMTDGMLASVPGADVAIGNGGSLRADVPAGPLTYGAVYEVYPFDNRLVTFAATGDQLTRIVAYNLQRTAPPTELLPIAGFRVDATCEGSLLRVTLTGSSGVPIRPGDPLTVTTSDFIAGGGDGILAPAGPLEFKSVEGAPLLREAVVARLRQRGGRLNESQFLAPGSRRWSYPRPRPVMCP